MKAKTRSQVMKESWVRRKAAARIKEMQDEQTGITSLMRGDSHSSGAQFDMVRHPPHYTAGRFEVIDVLEDWFEFEPLLWQVGKYIARWDKKGDALENLEKAALYLNRKISKLMGE